ncbi:MAG: anti-sigma factor domain-containing protein [Dermatophilaceae bacterium]
MAHVPEEVLAAAALGDPDVAPPDVDHLRSCATCAAGVAELRRVHLLLHETDLATDPDAEPDPAVWERIAAVTSPGRPQQTEPLSPTAQVGTRSTADHGRRRPHRWQLVAAALVCVLAGLGIGRLAWAPSQPSTRVISSTELDSLDGSSTLGRAELVDQAGGPELRVSTSPMPAAPGFVEVWLINQDGTRMVSLGVMASDQEVFAVPPAALAQGYRIVDLSRERYDNDARHSGDSIMRGTLPA